MSTIARAKNYTKCRALIRTGFVTRKLLPSKTLSNKVHNGPTSLQENFYLQKNNGSKLFWFNRNFFNSNSIHDNNISLKPSNVSRFSSKTYPDHEVIKLPALSPTMTSGNITEWNKSVGDQIEEGDSLLIVETDKSCIDFEMQQSGYLAYISPKKNDLKIGEPIGILVDDEKLVKEFKDFKFDDVASSEHSEKNDSPQEASEISSSPEKPVQEKNDTPEKTSHGTILSSPSARRLAKNLNIDLTSLEGSGPNGRIVNADVLTAAGSKETAQPITSVTPPSSYPEYLDTPLSALRHAIIKNLGKTKPLVPEYSVSITADVTQLLAIKDKLNSVSKGDYKITFTDLIIKVTCKVLKIVPELNSHFIGDAIRTYNPVNISIAIASDSGLYAPVIKNADKLSLLEISSSVKALSKKTREKKLSPSDLSGGTFSLSNMGMFSVESFNSIIVTPQVGILSVGAVTNKYEPSNIDEKSGNISSFVSKKCMTFTLTSDHRAIDGHIAAKWIQNLKNVIENPYNLLL